MKKDLPIYDVYISDDKQGVAMISLVDDPAIKVNWIKLKSHEDLLDLPMTLTDRGICFGCPPNGDGTRVNGEPDARCKGDGDDKKGGGGRSKAGGKTTSSKSKELKNAEKIAKAAATKILNSTFEDPATNVDYNTATQLVDEVKRLEELKERQKNKTPYAGTNMAHLDWQTGIQIQRVESFVKGDGRYDDSSNLKQVNKSYDDHVSKEIAKLPNPYGAKPSYVNEDRTWDYKKGMPTDAPAGKTRALQYERRSYDDVMEGYPAYKVYIDWE